MRQSVGGQEKFHGAIISHAGTDDTRIFREFEQLGAELHQLGGQILDARTNADVGILCLTGTAGGRWSFAAAQLRIWITCFRWLIIIVHSTSRT